MMGDSLKDGKSTVALIDDDIDFVRVHGSILRDGNINTDGFIDVNAFFAKLASSSEYRQNLAVILLDLRMPIDGMKVIQKFRNTYPNLLTRITVLSGYLSEERKQELINLGANDFYTKSQVDFQDLILKLKGAISQFELSNRDNQSHQQSGLQNLGINIDTDTRVIFLLDKKLDLTPSEFEIFALLAENFGKYRTIDEINAALFPGEQRQGSDSFRGFIKKINDKARKLYPKMSSSLILRGRKSWALTTQEFTN